MFVSQGIIFGFIRQLYIIDLRISNLYQQKFYLQHVNGKMSQQKAAAYRSESGICRIRLLNLRRRDGLVEFSETLYTGAKPVVVPTNNYTGVDVEAATFQPVVRRAIIRDNRYVLENALPGAVATVERSDGKPADELTRGEVLMTKEEALAYVESVQQELASREKELDVEIESIKAQRQALVSARDEYTKYVQKGIETAFKNNYA